LNSKEPQVNQALREEESKTKRSRLQRLKCRRSQTFRVDLANVGLDFGVSHVPGSYSQIDKLGLACQSIKGILSTIARDFGSKCGK